MPAHSQADQELGPAETEPAKKKKKKVFQLEQCLGPAHGAATHVVPHSFIGTRMCLGRRGC